MSFVVDPLVRNLSASLVVWLTTTTSLAGTATAADITLRIDPADALFGIAPVITVEGASPGERVTVSASSVDARRVRWVSSAEFVADAQGRVAVSHQAPLSGSYDGADGLGLLWSMAPEKPPKRGERPYEFEGLDVLLVEVQAKTASGRTATALLRRYYQLPGKALVRLPVAEQGLRGYLYHPTGKGPFPGVLLLTGSNGGLVEWLAQAFASHGFATLTLAYFRYQDLPPEMDEIPLEYFEQALGWMRAQPAVRKDRLAVVGGSRGGELALLLGATFPSTVTAVVAWVPDSIVWQSENMERQARGEVVSAWSRGGKGLPFAPFIITAQDMEAIEKGTLTSTRHMADMSRLDPAVLEQATIPVEKINGPVLLVSGSDDQTGPSDEACRRVMERLERFHRPFERKHLDFAGAGHLVFIPYLVTSGHRFMNGGNARADAHGGVESWRETLAFLRRHFEAR